ncbi:hypothetical protein ACE1TI_14460 [Alteribacillus sp. JSM 102045]|uniref:hypothetical protein n=1 Tax=Alteribacillus sp. JSM 102045 TaxID=1562101 RepID=UPI0035C1160C
MIKESLRKRDALISIVIKGKNWGGVDETGLLSFEKHYDHCLKRNTPIKKPTKNERYYVMHHILEAKLVVGDIVLSIVSEFIGNGIEIEL